VFTVVSLIISRKKLKAKCDGKSITSCRQGIFLIIWENLDTLLLGKNKIVTKDNYEVTDLS